MKILFVCTGNTCRSSMAEGLLKAILKERCVSGDVAVLSAGTMALPGSPAATQAITVLDETGIDISGHQANLLNAELLATADLVLTMTGVHRLQVLQLDAGAVKKVFVLGEYAGIAGDIPDPIGQPQHVYVECAQTLKQLINKSLDKFLKGCGY